VFQVPKRKRLSGKSRKAKRKVRMSDVMMQAGAGLAIGGAVAGGLGYAKGGEITGAGLGLAGAGIGVGLLESVGEGLQKSGKKKWGY